MMNISDIIPNITRDNEVPDVAEENVMYVVQLLNVYVPVVHLTFGTFGNAVSAYVMWIWMRRVSALCGYLLMLAITDTAMLFVDVGSEWFAALTEKSLDHDIMSHSETTCKTFHFLRHYLDHVGCWIVVCVAIETLRVTSDPLKLFGFPRKRVMDSIVLVIALLALLNVHYFWTYGVGTVEVRRDKITSCMFVAKTLQGYTEEDWCKHVLEQIHWAVADIIPLTIIAVIIALVARVRKQYRAKIDMARRARFDLVFRDAKLDPTCSIQNLKDSPMMLVDRTFWVLFIAFIILRTPYLLVREIVEGVELASDVVLDSPSWQLSSVCLKTLRHAFWSGKIVLYCATWSRFRTEVYQLLRSIGRCVRRVTTSHVPDTETDVTDTNVTLSEHFT